MCKEINDMLIPICESHVRILRKFGKVMDGCLKWEASVDATVIEAPVTCQ